MNEKSTFPEARLINVGEINLAVHESGSGRPVILVHGFPELAFSWRHQVPVLAEAGYRVIVPDMRGYGASDKPANVGDYTVQKLLGDLTGLMDVLGLDDAIVVGHDWGALLTWQMALLHPERMAGLVAVNIPFFRRPPVNPITYMRFKLGRKFYIVNFQDSQEADRRFAEDPARFIDRMMRVRRIDRAQPANKRRKRRPLSLLEMLDRPDATGKALLTADELRVYADAFAAGGFTGPINWYRNFAHNWKSTKGVDQTVRVPSLFIEAADDAIVSRRQIEAMKPHVPDLEIRTIDDCGHWTQQERPAVLNALLLDWFGRRFSG